MTVGYAILATIGWVALITGLWLIARLAFQLGKQARRDGAHAFRDQHFTPVHTTPLAEGAQEDHAGR